MGASQELSRRQFVTLAAGCAAACACGVTLGEAATGPLDVGVVGDYPKDAIYDKFIKSDRVVVYREQGQIYASTADCTHRGARLVVKGDELYCPRHGSTFSPAGTVTNGPAEDSLERYAISLDGQNHLIVDRSKSFREKDWNDPASFVKVG
jgi:nitrite reductase/ring-hydroxylating ferredoxin subunit